MTNRLWWAINSDDLKAALVRAHNGEDPDIILMDLYLDSDHYGNGDDGSNPEAPSPE